jgi:hypothetical protein
LRWLLGANSKCWHSQPSFDRGRKTFLLEHLVPVNILRDGCRQADGIVPFLWKTIRLAWIHKDEDAELTRRGYRNHRANPLIAYAEVGIQLT